MISQHDYEIANAYYSKGQLSYPELIAVIKGQVTLEQALDGGLYA